MSKLRLWLLGPPQAELDGEPVHIGRRKAVALLAYLGVTARRHSRDSLAALLWPEYDQTRARADLRRTLSVLNKTLGAGWLSADRETAGLSEAADLWLDVDGFQRLIAACETHGHPATESCEDCLPLLKEAVELYRDDFLAGFSLRDSLNFDEWQLFQTESLRQELAAALERLARGHAQQENHELALPYARRWLTLDPLHEPAHRQLMQLYAQAGQWSAVVRQYQECVSILQDELGMPPGEESTALYERLRLDLKDAGRVTRYNLPPQSTSFIGREEELVELGRLLADPDARLITLVGPGGIGKTRLALEVAAKQLNMFANGVTFVALQPIGSPDLLAMAIAEAIGFSFREQENPDVQLINYLAERETLLVLDNFEHLLSGAELLTAILEEAAGVKLLVTSRELLNLQAEWVWRLQGMRYPEAEQVAEIEEYGALKLFVERARRVRRDVSPDAEQACMIRICQLVGGMPLGIELASSWLKNLPCEKIVREIERNLDFLATSMSDIPQRHRSMRAVFEHSWQLLDEKERQVLKKLSVFRGGFRQEAAEQVAGASLLALSSLVDKSLLRVTPAGRFEFHELLRQFAESRLKVSAGEMQRALDSHCAYYTDFLYQRRDDSKGPKQVQFMVDIEEEIQNARAAWNRAVAQENLDDIGRSMDSLWRFHVERCWYLQGDRAFSNAITALRGGNALGKRGVVLGRLLARQGWIAGYQIEFVKMRECAQESMAILERLGARQETIIPLIVWTWVHRAEGDIEKARQVGLKLMAIALEFDDRWTLALAHLQQAVIANDYQEAERYANESVMVFRQIGDRWGVAIGLCRMSKFAREQGTFPEAAQLALESLTTARESNSQVITLEALIALGDVYFALGEYEKAKQTRRDGLAISKEVVDRLALTYFLIGLADIALTLDEDEVAGQMYGDSLIIAEEMNDRTLIALSHQGLGRVAFRVGEFAIAQRYYVKGLALLKGGVGFLGQVSMLIISAHNDLGLAAHAQRNDPEARSHFSGALKRGLEIGVFPSVLESIVGTAELMMAEGRLERAVELLSLGRQHTASHAATKFRADRLLAELEDEIPADLFAAARRRGATSELKIVAEDLLAHLARS